MQIFEIIKFMHELIYRAADENTDVIHISLKKRSENFFSVVSFLSLVAQREKNKSELQ